jgi:hypothetical protein
LINPRRAVDGQTEDGLLLEVLDGGNHDRDRYHGQQGVDQLLPQFTHGGTSHFSTQFRSISTSIPEGLLSYSFHWRLTSAPTAFL